ncbi:hypothetical protein Tco_0332340 [Tanacetum coccineum]
MARRPLGWKVVEDVNQKKFSNGGVIVVEDDLDVIHFDNSFDLALSTSLNDLDFATLHIDGPSIDVDAPPDIIDVDEYDDIIDDEDAFPHDLADSDNEDLVNVDDDDGVAMSADVARGHDDDGGGDDHHPPHQIGGGCQGHLKTQPGRQESRQDAYPQGNQEPQIKEDHGSIWPTGGPHNIEEERKAGVMGKIRTQLDLKPHVQSNLWPKIKKGVEQHLAKIYTDNKSALKANHWVKNPEDGTYDVEAIKSRLPANISAADWDEQIRFWSDPKNMARYGELPDSRDEMQRLQALGEYTDDQIMVIVRKDKQRRHIPGVGKVLTGRGKDVLDVVMSDDKISQLLTHLQSQHDVRSDSGSGAGGDDESGDNEDADEDEEDKDS